MNKFKFLISQSDSSELCFSNPNKYFHSFIQNIKVANETGILFDPSIFSSLKDRYPRLVTISCVAFCRYFNQLPLLDRQRLNIKRIMPDGTTTHEFISPEQRLRNYKALFIPDKTFNNAIGFQFNGKKVVFLLEKGVNLEEVSKYRNTGNQNLSKMNIIPANILKSNLTQESQKLFSRTDVLKSITPKILYRNSDSRPQVKNKMSGLYIDQIEPDSFYSDGKLKNIVVMDPGYKSYDFLGPLTIDSNTDLKKMKVSLKERRNFLNPRESINIILKLKYQYNKAMNFLKQNRNIRNSFNYDSFFKFASQKQIFRSQIDHVYNDIKFRNLEFAKFIKNQKWESKLTDSLTREYGRDLIVIYGDYCSGMFSNHRTGSSFGDVMTKHKIQSLLISEFNTSQMCSARKNDVQCISKMERVRFSNKFGESQLLMRPDHFSNSSQHNKVIHVNLDIHSESLILNPTSLPSTGKKTDEIPEEGEVEEKEDFENSRTRYNKRRREGKSSEEYNTSHPRKVQKTGTEIVRGRSWKILQCREASCGYCANRDTNACFNFLHIAAAHIKGLPRPIQFCPKSRVNLVY